MNFSRSSALNSILPTLSVDRCPLGTMWRLLSDHPVAGIFHRRPAQIELVNFQKPLPSLKNSKWLAGAGRRKTLHGGVAIC